MEFPTRERKQKKLDLDSSRFYASSWQKCSLCILPLLFITLMLYFFFRWLKAFKPNNQNSLFGYYDLPTRGNTDYIYYVNHEADPTCRKNQRTFKQSEAYAKEQGGRLCTSEEIRTLLADKGGYLAVKRSYVATQDGDFKNWIDVSMIDPGNVVAEDSVNWSKDFNKYQPEDQTYPYWVGTT